jgi:hypothetical protein
LEQLKEVQKSCKTEWEAAVREETGEINTGCIIKNDDNDI